MIIIYIFFFSSRRRHTIFKCDWSSDVCSSDLASRLVAAQPGWARTLSQLSRTGRAAGALRRRSRLHPYRGDADDGIPVRRLVGLSADLAVRADLAPWRSRRLPRLYRFLPPRRARLVARLGAGAFPNGRSWARD